MAEAAALALASSITQAMQIHNCNFLSDCQQLVHFLNKPHLSNPPDWRIKPFTQHFANNANHTSSRLFKINRNLNSTADGLARQALASQALDFHSHCSNVQCGPFCSVMHALLFVDLPCVNIIVASCCS
jgi:hypothetical protein